MKKKFLQPQIIKKLNGTLDAVGTAAASVTAATAVVTMGTSAVVALSIGFVGAALIDKVKENKNNKQQIKKDQAHPLEKIIDDYDINHNIDNFQFKEITSVEDSEYTGVITFNGRNFNFKISDSSKLSQLVDNYYIETLLDAMETVTIDNVSENLKARLVLHMARSF